MSNQQPKPKSASSRWSHLLDLGLILMGIVLLLQWTGVISALTGTNPQPEQSLEEQLLEEWDSENEEILSDVEQYSLTQRLQAIANRQTTRLELASSDDWTPANVDLFKQISAQIRVLIVFDPRNDWIALLDASTEMTALEQLHCHTSTGPELFRILHKIPNLSVLNAPQVSLECQPEDFQQLKQLTRLSLLRMGGRGIDDQFVTLLTELTKLRFLHLIKTSIDDEAAMQFSTLPLLESLYIDESPVTEAGLWQLCQLSPELHVHWNDLHLTLDE